MKNEGMIPGPGVKMITETDTISNVFPIAAKDPPPFAPVDPKNPTRAEALAAQKIMTVARRKRRKKRSRRRVRIREVSRRDMVPGEREWRVFSHDFDAIYHELVRNPSAIRLTPKQFIARCEKIADEYGKMQARRCPKGVARF